MTSDENNSICACAEHLRAECQPGRYFRNAAGQHYCLRHYPGTATPETLNASDDFTCGCEWVDRSACTNQPFFKQHEGKNYCVLHYPGTDKLEGFRVAISKKLAEQDYNFYGVWFPEKADFHKASFSAKADFSDASFSAEADFSDASFSAVAYFIEASFSAEASFSGASFSAEASFSGASFSAEATFSGASFSADTEATFSKASFSAEAYFMGASFSAEAYFSRASFSAEANFEGASFSAKARFSGANFSADAYFMGASFSAEADFYGASFKDYAHFAGSKERKALGEKAYLDLQFAKFEKPERVSFHTLILRPNWFINVDSRKFEFVDVEWNFRLKEELKSASEAKVSAPHRLLAITYRQLADNAEANHRYHEASRFRYNAFEARRIEKFHGFVPWRLDWWYWLASGYGESVGRAFLVFVALLALLTLGYKRSEFVPTAPTAAPPATVVANTAPPTAPDLPPKRLGWREAALYSFNVSILQKPEPKPKGLWSSFLVSLETVLGPAQAALLALAVRRRFMR